MTEKTPDFCDVLQTGFYAYLPVLSHGDSPIVEMTMLIPVTVYQDQEIEYKYQSNHRAF